MTQEQAQTVICRYRVKPGKEAEMMELLRKHWPALRSLGLATSDPPLIYRSVPSGKLGGDHDSPDTFVEIFSWTSARAPEIAHQTPEVMAVWEPMGAICDDMDFPHFERIDLKFE